MAFSDYHPCDNCGERKTFYDADMTAEWVDGGYRYGYAKGGEGYSAFPGYRAYALCLECEKTHEIVIRQKGSNMTHPTDRDYRNLEERNAAYWREQADKLAEAHKQIEFLSTNHGGWFDQPGQQFTEYVKLGRIAGTALAEYNASK